MKVKPALDTIAKGQLVVEVQARFRAPTSGGRRTDPAWTERRLISLTPQTLRRLEQVARVMSEGGVRVGPLQVAALLLERAVAETDEATVTSLAEGHTDGGG